MATLKNKRSKAKQVTLWYDDEHPIRTFFLYYLYRIWPWSRFQQYHLWLVSFQNAVDLLRQETRSLKIQRDFLAEAVVNLENGKTGNRSVSSVIEAAEQYAKEEQTRKETKR